MKTKIIGVWNIKGGEGKTTTAINLSVGLFEKGKKVLLIDLDSQANLSSSLIKENMKNNYKCMTDLFVPNRTITTKECLYTSNFGVDVIGSNLALTNAELILRADPMINQNMILEKIIGEVKENYDYIIIDCPPSLNLLTTNMCLVSNLIITPVSTDEWSFDGYKQTVNNINILNQNFDKKIKQKILFTKVTRIKVDKESIKEIQEKTELAFSTKIRNQSAILKKGGKNKIVVTMKEKTKKGKLVNDIGSDYRNLVNEIINWEEV